MTPIRLSLLLIGLAAGAAAAPTVVDPTPLQRKERDRDEIERRIVNTKLALAYSCGYMEGRTKVVDTTCMEMRAIATEHGFKR